MQRRCLLPPPPLPSKQNTHKIIYVLPPFLCRSQNRLTHGQPPPARPLYLSLHNSITEHPEHMWERLCVTYMARDVHHTHRTLPPPVPPPFPRRRTLHRQPVVAGQLFWLKQQSSCCMHGSSHGSSVAKLCVRTKKSFLYFYSAIISPVFKPNN